MKGREVVRGEEPMKILSGYSARLLGALMGALMLAVCINTASAQTTSPTPQAKWVGDLPIMPSLSIETDLGFAFDSPEGRIVIVYLSGDVTLGQVASYYDVALEPLGWMNNGGQNWTRAHEQLTIRQTTAGDAELWKVTIRPE